jgi:hypothetical protein
MGTETSLPTHGNDEVDKKEPDTEEYRTWKQTIEEMDEVERQRAEEDEQVERQRAAEDAEMRERHAQELERLLQRIRNRVQTDNTFCATGEGGGIDPTCSPGETSGSQDHGNDNQEHPDLDEIDHPEAHALRERHATELEQLQTKRDLEDNAGESRRNVEDEKLNNKREKEDDKLRLTRDKEDAKIESQREREDDKLSTGREKEDNKLQSQWEKEDDKIQLVRDREDEKLASTREKEDDVIQSKHDAEDQEIEDRYDKDKSFTAEIRVEAHDNNQSARDDEDTTLTDKRNDEDSEIQENRGNEDQARIDHRQAIQDQLAAQRDEEDRQISERRDRENEELKDKRDIEDINLEAARLEEDKRLEEKRQVEDDTREALREHEDAQIEDRHNREARELLARLRMSGDLKTNAGQWAYDSSPDKVKRFRAWLRQQMDSTLAGDQLIERFVDDAFTAGARRAFTDVRKAKATQGGRDELLRTLNSKRAVVESVKLLAGRTFAELEDVNAQMAARMSRILATGLVTNSTPEEIADELVKETTLELGRAQMIARTELIRAHAEGQLTAMEHMGIETVNAAVEWDTADDGHVCNKCSPLSGLVLKIEEARGMLPRHPNAVFAGSTFVSYGECEEIVRAWYDGPAVVLTLRGGRHGTTIGPNHPVMTRRGMVRAAELCKDDEVLYDHRCNRSSASVDLKQVPTVEDVFTSVLLNSGNTATVASTSDLHGDIVFCQGEVETVRPALGLLPVLDSFGIEQFREDNLTRTNTQLSLGTGSRTGFFRTKIVNRPATCRVCGRDISLSDSGIGLLAPQEHAFTSSSGFTSSLQKPAVNGTTRTVKSVSNSLGTKTSVEQLDYLLNRNRQTVYEWVPIHSIVLSRYKGWAFDATTATSLYCSDSIVVSNCRCCWTPALEQNEGQKRGAREVRAAIKKSAKAEANRLDDVKWGPGTTVDTDRPEPVGNAVAFELTPEMLSLSKCLSVLGLNSFCPTGEGGGVDPSCSPHKQVLDALSKLSSGAHPVRLAQDLKGQKVTQKAIKLSLDALEKAGLVKQTGGIYSVGAPSTARDTPVADASKSAEQPQTVSPADHLSSVAQAILRNPRFDIGLVDIADVAKDTGKSATETFKAVERLIKEGVLTGSGYEGRHGISQAQQDVIKAQGSPQDRPAYGYIAARDRKALEKFVKNVFCPTGEGGGVDPSCGKNDRGPSKKGAGRHEDSAPPAKDWVEPPPKLGKKGSGKAVRPVGDESQTKIGDLGESLAENLGFRNILPEGQRSHRPGEVAEKGSTIDLEWDHSGRAYELKLCNTTATEYRLKAKASEKEAKVKYAEQNGLTPYTMVAVRDPEKQEVHFYAAKEPGLIGAEVSPKKFDYVGKVKY